MSKKKISFRVHSYPTRSRKFQKNIIKIKKHHSGFISSQKKKWERSRMSKKFFSFGVQSYPTQSRKFQKNSIKIQKIKKHHSGFISCQNGTREPKNEIFIYLFLIFFFHSESVSIQPGLENLKKKKV